MWILASHTRVRTELGDFLEQGPEESMQVYEELLRGWRKLYNEELHNSYSSPNSICAIKSKRMK
jgi:hypothetical protein